MTRYQNGNRIRLLEVTDALLDSGYRRRLLVRPGSRARQATAELSDSMNDIEERRRAEAARDRELDERWFSKYGHISPSTWLPRSGEIGPRIYCADPSCNCHKYPKQDY